MKKIFLILLAMLFLPCLAMAQKVAVLPLIAKEYDGLVALYKDLHQNPEISFQEKETAAKLAKELKKLGFEVTEGVGGYGLVAVLRNGTGKTILVRADMDALPMLEETNLEYASKAFGKDDSGQPVPAMHGCGHDIHMTVLIGTAKVLAASKKDWRGTVVLVAQPAEERGSGAKAMLKEGLYTKFPKPDYALALHTSASLPAGSVGLCSEYALANVDMVDIWVYGEGGHGAYPHLTKDPIVLASQIVVALQTVVSRETNPIEPAVLTVGAFHAGTKHNVIPNEAHLKLTLRSYSAEVRQNMIQQINRICAGMAQAAGLLASKYPKVVVNESEALPSLYNDPTLTKELETLFGKLLGTTHTVKSPPVLGAEDFGLFGRDSEHKVPICLYWLGTVNETHYQEFLKGERKLPSLHSSKYAPQISPTLETGIRTMSEAVLMLLAK
ncbi:MAG: amidohydrolase [Cytophagales bacterium]|nr:MAG: amidohydrolase [Cytophagales bacterium]TAF62118.1 MAG: amidohydrolase [Cytophagales bacterium]